MTLDQCYSVPFEVEVSTKDVRPTFSLFSLMHHMMMWPAKMCMPTNQERYCFQTINYIWNIMFLSLGILGGDWQSVSSWFVPKSFHPWISRRKRKGNLHWSPQGQSGQHHRLWFVPQRRSGEFNRTRLNVRNRFQLLFFPYQQNIAVAPQLLVIPAVQQPYQPRMIPLMMTLKLQLQTLVTQLKALVTPLPLELWQHLPLTHQTLLLLAAWQPQQRLK